MTATDLDHGPSHRARGSWGARLLREPLLHFLVLGALLFAADAWRNRTAPPPASGRQVRLGAGEVKWLEETWAAQWQRAPSADELRRIVTEFLKEELLAREARELGLDQDDTYVRRRLAQKVQFLIDDTSRLAEPTEADLEQFYTAHPELFRDPARLSFTQVFFAPEHRAEVAAARARLASGADPDAEGDRLLVEREHHDEAETDVAQVFGARFAAALAALERGAWSGPIESSYGLHLVRVDSRVPARLRPFGEVRATVAARWRDQRRRADAERYFAALRKKYDLRIDDSVRPLIGDLAGQQPVTP